MRKIYSFILEHSFSGDDDYDYDDTRRLSEISVMRFSLNINSMCTFHYVPPILDSKVCQCVSILKGSNRLLLVHLCIHWK